MQIQILDWNISFKCKIDLIIDYLKTQIEPEKPCIINLQEVRPHSYEALKMAFGDVNIAYSLNLRRPGKFEGRNRELGTAIITINSNLLEYELVATSMVPERTLFAKIQAGKVSIGILNFHSLTGKSYKNSKASNFASLASYIHARELEIDFLAFDANEPFKDYQDLSTVVFYDNGDKGKNASLILGQDRVHGLTDSLRTYYTDKGISNQQEPLVKSHKTKRFDYIFHSPKWKVLSIEYPLIESLRASSDHSLVKGLFEYLPE